MSGGFECKTGVLYQDPGWWRPDTNIVGFGTPLYECFSEACIGSGSGEENAERPYPMFDQQCDDGYTGPICALCEPDYTRQGDVCAYCPRFNAQNIVGVVVLVAVVVGLLIWFYRHRHSAWMQPTVIKIVLTFFEMIANLEETFDIQWPVSYRLVTARIRAAFASFVELSALSCATHINRFWHLTIWTCGMLLILAVLRARYRRALKCASPADHGRLRQKWLAHSNYVFFFAYPLVSPVVMSIFICRTIEGTSYLVADYTLRCEGTQWALAVAWAALWTTIYVVAYPLVLLRALHQHSSAVDFISQEYKHEGVARYWEVVEFAKKLFLTSLLLFFPEGTSTRISLAVLVTGITLVAFVWLKPFHHGIHNRLDLCASSALVLTYFIGLAVKVDPVASQRQAYAVILILLLVGVLVAAIMGFAMARRAFI
eukprot:g3845.t1